jgi:hypothetical protein
MPYNVAMVSANVPCREWVVDEGTVPADDMLNGRRTAAKHLASYRKRGKGDAVELPCGSSGVMLGLTVPHALAV